MPKAVQPLLQVRGQRSLYRDLSSRGRTNEHDTPGMQERSLPCAGAIHTIPRNRMAQARQMGANLVRAPRPDAYFEIRKSFEALQDAIFGQRFAPVVQARGHSSAANGITRNRLDNSSSFAAHTALNQGKISLLHRTPGELRGQCAMGRIRAGHEQHAAGYAVEAMHDARAQIAAYV